MNALAGTLGSFVKTAFANWMAKTLLQAVENEGLEMMGLQQSDLIHLRQTLRQQSRHQGKVTSTIRAELPPFTFC